MIDRKGLMLNLNSRCNLRCSYCYQMNTSEHGRQASATLINSVKELLTGNHSITHVQLLGGEPFLSKPLVLNLLSFARKENETRPGSHKLGISIITNGTLYFRELEEYRDMINLQISIDGGREYHDRNRVDALGVGSYDRIIKNIHQYATAGVPFYLHSVVANPILWYRSLPSLAQDLRGIQYLYSFNWDITSIKPIRDVFTHMFVTIFGERRLTKLGIKYATPITHKFAQATCQGGQGFLSIDNDGQVYSCEIKHDEAYLGEFVNGRFQFRPGSTQNVLDKMDISKYRVQYLPKWLSKRFLEGGSFYKICNIKNINQTGNQYTIPFRDALYVWMAKRVMKKD